MLKLQYITFCFFVSIYFAIKSGFDSCEESAMTELSWVHDLWEVVY